jgi:hypothetical protein
MKFYDLKHKFRRAVLTVMFMLSSMVGCKSPAPPKEQTPEDQDREWVKTRPDATPVYETNQNFHTAAGRPERSQAQTRLPPPARTKSRAFNDVADRVNDNLNEQGAVNPPHSINLIVAPADPDSLLKPNAVNFLQNENPAPPPPRTDWLKLPAAKDVKWKFKVYASHAFTHYFPSDITMKTSRYDVKIKDFEWVSRDGNNWFSPKTFLLPGNNPAQMIDEPTNTATFALEKNADIFFISAFHPKFLEDPNQVKLIQGTVDGVAVDHVAPVNTPFHGYNNTPGEMKLARNENTYRQMEYEIGYAHKFSLINSKKFGKLSYVPGISAGFQMGATVSVVVKKNAWWDFDGYTEKTRIQGVGGSIRNKLEWTTPNERFGIFYENKTALYHREQGLLDGTQEFNLAYTSHNAGLTVMIYNPNHKKTHKP